MRKLRDRKVSRRLSRKGACQSGFSRKQNPEDIEETVHAVVGAESEDLQLVSWSPGELISFSLSLQV